MKTLYVVAPETFTGKSALCVGLGKKLQRDGYKVGYMKPVSVAARCLAPERADQDASFLKSLLGLDESPAMMAPICVDHLRLEETMSGREEDSLQTVQSAFETISSDKDIVLLEGGNSLMEGFVVGAPIHEISRALGAKEVMILRWTSSDQVDHILASRAILGSSLLGVVINAVATRDMAFVKEVVVPFLERKGLKVYGVLPQERILRSITVRELAGALGGDVLCCSESLDDLVENLMVGAMSVDSALSHFRRKPNKVVITGGDRADIQLAALETSTKCIVLTGNLSPSPIILGKAEESGVPIILVTRDTFSAVEVAEQSFYRTRFNDVRKVARFERLMGENFDFESLYSDLELS